MSTQQRLTITLPTDSDTIIHLRTTGKAEARQKQICILYMSKKVGKT
jgi:hypothetical protein